MSLSPSFPQGAPTLAEVLLQRTFAKPPKPFVDGEFLEALEKVDDRPPATVEIRRPAGSGGASDAESGSGEAPASGADVSSSPGSDGGAPGRTVDVRV